MDTITSINTVQESNISPTKNHLSQLIVSVLFLILGTISIYLYIDLQNSMITMQKEIETIKNEAQKNLQSQKDESKKEISLLEERIKKMEADSKNQSDEGTLSADTIRLTADYLRRSQDTARTVNLRTISIGVGAYYADNERYPEGDTSGCFSIPQSELYFPNGIPKDPLAEHINAGCTRPGEYAYRNLKNGQRSAFSATLETENGGNSTKPLNEYTDDELEKTDFIKNSGPYYILTN